MRRIEARRKNAKGVVTSLKEERENSASRIFSNDRDCLAPHVHSRRAKGSVRPCRSEMMRILGSIVAPSTTLMSSCDSKITGSGSIRPQIVRDQLVWDKSILLQQLAHEFQRGTLVPPALDQHIKHFALGIHGAPKIDHAAGDFQIDLIQMPGSVGLGSTFA